MQVKRALLVEDEFIVAMFIEDMLADMHISVSEICADVEAGLDAIMRGDFDFAILDVSLSGDTSFALADQLQSMGLPFLFVTGYSPSAARPIPYAAPILQKPFSYDGFRAALDVMTSEPPGRRTG